MIFKKYIKLSDIENTERYLLKNARTGRMKRRKKREKMKEDEREKKKAREIRFLSATLLIPSAISTSSLLLPRKDGRWEKGRKKNKKKKGRRKRENGGIRERQGERQVVIQ